MTLNFWPFNRCKHRFAIEDMVLTGIRIEDEYSLTDKGHCMRVYLPCDKCGKTFYAHCALDITPKHGPLFRRDEL